MNAQCHKCDLHEIGDEQDLAFTCLDIACPGPLCAFVVCAYSPQLRAENSVGGWFLCHSSWCPVDPVTVEIPNNETRSFPPAGGCLFFSCRLFGDLGPDITSYKSIVLLTFGKTIYWLLQDHARRFYIVDVPYSQKRPVFLCSQTSGWRAASTHLSLHQ